MCWCQIEYIKGGDFVKVNEILDWGVGWGVGDRVVRGVGDALDSGVCDDFGD